MAALNISFEIPQSPTFSVDEFSRLVKNYANSLIERMSQSADKPRVLKYEELDPVIKELCGVCKVPEWDMNGDFAKEEFLADVKNRNINIKKVEIGKSKYVKIHHK